MDIRRSFYLHNEISYTNKTIFLCWTRPYAILVSRNVPPNNPAHQGFLTDSHTLQSWQPNMANQGGQTTISVSLENPSTDQCVLKEDENGPRGLNSFALDTSESYFRDALLPRYRLQWRHNEHDGVSNHQPHDCLLNRLFRPRWKKTSKLCVTGLCEGNSPGTGEIPAQRTSYAENVSIWWRHLVRLCVCFMHSCFRIKSLSDLNSEYLNRLYDELIYPKIKYLWRNSNRK